MCNWCPCEEAVEEKPVNKVTVGEVFKTYLLARGKKDRAVQTYLQEALENCTAEIELSPEALRFVIPLLSSQIMLTD